MPDNNPMLERKSRGKAAGGIESLVQAEKLLQIAFILPSAMVVGWLAGAWADMKLHQSWMTIAGLIFGCTAGLVYVVRLAMDAEKRAGSATKNSGSGSGDPK
jgi:F0F1-type ATP synthase assembly protein I